MAYNTGGIIKNEIRESMFSIFDFENNVFGENSGNIRFNLPKMS